MCEHTAIPRPSARVSNTGSRSSAFEYTSHHTTCRTVALVAIDSELLRQHLEHLRLESALEIGELRRANLRGHSRSRLVPPLPRHAEVDVVAVRRLTSHQPNRLRRDAGGESRRRAADAKTMSTEMLRVAAYALQPLPNQQFAQVASAKNTQSKYTQRVPHGSALGQPHTNCVPSSYSRDIHRLQVL